MVQAQDGGGSPLGTYYYDGEGRRIKKIVPNGETTIFVYDASGKMVAEYSTELSQTPEVGYLTSDNLGTPRINTNAAGGVVSRHDYHPFGEEISTSQRTAGSGYQSDSIRKQFTGYERDNESGLDFAQARMYANQLGRFTATDPVIISKDHPAAPQRWNLYIYVVNNPLKFTDPDGQKPRQVIDVFLTYDASKEKRAEWKKLRQQAAKKGVRINIYTASDGTATASRFLKSVEIKGRIVVLAGHSYSDEENAPKHKGIGLEFYNYSNDTATTISTMENLVNGNNTTHTLDQTTVQAKTIAVFVCNFGRAFDRVTSSNNTNFIYSKGGRDGESGLYALNQAALELSRVLVNGGTVRQAQKAALEGFDTYRRPGDDDDTIVLGVIPRVRQ